MHGLTQELGSCRRVPGWQGLNALGYGGMSQPPWDTAPDVHFSKILIRPFIFQNHDKLNIKKSSELVKRAV
jgi:hypothetical protein